MMVLILISASADQSGFSKEYKAAYEEAYQAAYDKAFRSSFRIRTIEQCRASAKNAAAAQIDATPICACVTDRLLATKSVDELKAQFPVAELQSLSTECIAANPAATKSERP